MHAMLVVIKLDDEEEALRSLKDDVIPQMQQAPGFSTGIWFGNEQKGHALCCSTLKNMRVTQRRR